MHISLHCANEKGLLFSIFFLFVFSSVFFLLCSLSSSSSFCSCTQNAFPWQKMLKVYLAYIFIMNNPLGLQLFFFYCLHTHHAVCSYICCCCSHSKLNDNRKFAPYLSAYLMYQLYKVHYVPFTTIVISEALFNQRISLAFYFYSYCVFSIICCVCTIQMHDRRQR